MHSFFDVYRAVTMMFAIILSALVTLRILLAENPNAKEQEHSNAVRNWLEAVIQLNEFLGCFLISNILIYTFVLQLNAARFARKLLSGWVGHSKLFVYTFTHELTH